MQTAVAQALVERELRDIKHDIAGMVAALQAMGAAHSSKLESIFAEISTMKRDMALNQASTDAKITATKTELKEDFSARMGELEKKTMPKDAFMKAIIQASAILGLVMIIVNLASKVVLR